MSTLSSVWMWPWHMMYLLVSAALFLVRVIQRWNAILL
jgi:hypothetical protein